MERNGSSVAMDRQMLFKWLLFVFGAAALVLSDGASGAELNEREEAEQQLSGELTFLQLNASSLLLHDSKQETTLLASRVYWPTCDGMYQPLSEQRSLQFESGALAVRSRSRGPIGNGRQLQPRNASLDNWLFGPTSATCLNQGGILQISWLCSARLPWWSIAVRKHLTFTLVDIQCEGKNFDRDPCVLKNSCVLFYTMQATVGARAAFVVGVLVSAALAGLCLWRCCFRKCCCCGGEERRRRRATERRALLHSVSPQHSTVQVAAPPPAPLYGQLPLPPPPAYSTISQQHAPLLSQHQQHYPSQGYPQQPQDPPPQYTAALQQPPPSACQAPPMNPYYHPHPHYATAPPQQQQQPYL